MSDKDKTKQTVIVTAKCISCGHKETYGSNDVPEGEQPMCPKCFMPMEAVRAGVCHE